MPDQPETEVVTVPTTDVEVDALFLANAVEKPGSLVYVMGGGWTRCWPPPGQTYPFSRVIPLVVIFRIPHSEANRDFAFSVALKDGEEQDITESRASGSFKVGRDVDLTDGMSQVVVAGLNASVKLEKVGVYHVVVEVDGRMKKEIQFEALAGPPKSR